MQKIDSMRLALGTALFVLACTGSASAQTLTPTVNLLPPITLDTYDAFNFSSGTFSDFATPGGNTVMVNGTVNLNFPESSLNPLNAFVIPPTPSDQTNEILNSVALAQQQVQAALLYLQDHQAQILAGKDTFYNSVFGDFYVPNNAFTGQYDRTIQVPVLASPLTDNNGNVILGANGLPISDPSVDRFGNPLTVTTINTANYQDVVNTFTAIETALHGVVQFTTGGINQVQAGPNGSSFVPNDSTPVTGTASTNANSNLTTLAANAFFLQYSQTIPNSVGNSTYGNPQFSLQGATGPGGQTLDTGFIQWGDSNSVSPAHLSSLITSNSTILKWYQDDMNLVEWNPNTNQLQLVDPTLIDPATGRPITLERAEQLSALFEQQKLDAYAQAGFETDGQGNLILDANGNPIPVTQVYVGGAFVNGLTIQQNGLTDTTPTSTLVPSSLAQYQQLIMALAQSSTGGLVIPGLLGITGTNNPDFLQAFDAKSYAQFAALTSSLTNGIGDGSQLSPPGKSAQFLGNFLPVSNNLTFGNTILTGF